jgi:hypothetical protein
MDRTDVKCREMAVVVWLAADYPFGPRAPDAELGSASFTSLV